MKVENQELTKLRDINRSQIIEVEHVMNEETKQEKTEGHSHKQCQNNKCSHAPKDPTKRAPKNYCIIFYCFFTCFSCLYLETTQFYPLLQDNNRKAILTKLSYFLVFMALWSYIQTIRTNNDVKKLQGAPHVDNKKFLQANYLTKQCEYCKYYKPPRVSHCSTCGTCIYKLDHHCMWTQNCIGYRNQRPFLLFTIYMTLGLWQFWHASISTFKFMYGHCEFFSYYEPGVYILWLITTFSATFIGTMIIALFISHTMMILTNFTTLTGMKKKSVCHLPFCEFREMLLTDDKLNPFDRGQIQNTRSLFGTNVLTCWLPFTRQVENDFVFEEQNPLPTDIQIAKLSGQYYEDLEREKEIERLLPKIKQLYRGKKFLLDGQVIEI